jgi:hypothetical protein
MDLVLHIPDDVAAQLSASGDVERQALEGLALESLRAGRLTKSELRRLLGIPSRLQLDAFLKAHDVFEPYTVEDLDRERATFRRLGF